MQRIKTLSLCMIVKNEGKHLERCLNSVKQLVDEIIIVDTGSTDNTVDIAKKFGAKIYYYVWNDNFSSARNYSIKHASKEWILLMDADDEFNEDDYDKFVNLVNTSSKDGHYFKTLSFVGDKASENTVSNLNIRLIKNNSKYAFLGAIHEQLVEVEGSIDYNNFSSEDIIIFHYGYLNNVALEKEKRKRNISIINKELKNNPDNKFHLFNLGNEYFAMNEKEKAMQLFDNAYNGLDFKVGFASKLVIKRIICMDELGKHDKALEAIEEGLKHYPKFTDLEFIRGCIQFKKARYTLAIESFSKCIHMGKTIKQLEFINDCGTYRPYEALGEVYYKLEDYDKAFMYFDKALKYKPRLKNCLYKIGSIINKLNKDKKFVSYKICKYININNVSNLVLISQILIKEKLYDIALGYLQRAHEIDCSNSEVDFLIGKVLFYKMEFSEAVSFFKKISSQSSNYLESVKYLFVYYLIYNKGSIKALLNDIKNNGIDIVYKTYTQLYNIASDKKDIVLSQEDNAEEALKIVMDVLSEIIKVQEFDLFEKLLNILNVIESSKVLIELAKVYYDNRFGSMAVKEILRSIKEFNVIDYKCVDILYKEFY